MHSFIVMEIAFLSFYSFTTLKNEDIPSFSIFIKYTPAESELTEICSALFVDNLPEYKI